MLQCSGCAQWKDEELFPPSRGAGKVNRRRRCSECKAAKTKEWATRHPDYWKSRDEQAHREAARRDYWKNSYVRRYGITRDQRDRQAEIQDHRCAICSVETGLHTDHCHEDGIVRGLLCGSCNRGLGMFGDDVTRLEAAVAYLEAGGVWQAF